MQIIFLLLVWSAIDNDVVSCCFMTQRRRHYNVRHHTRRRSITPLLMMGDGDESMHSNKSNYKHTNHPSTNRVHNNLNSNNNVVIPKQPQNGSVSPHLKKLKMKEAKLVEKLLFDAVDKMNRSKQSGVTIPPSKLFPSVRQCNAALATFGDAGEFRRALKLFTQMKKSASLFNMNRYRKSTQATTGDDRYYTNEQQSTTILHSIDLVLDPPKPSLVTYSTLMSRAVSLGKPRVALRLWNLMKNQPNFHANVISRNLRDHRVANMDLQKLESKENDVIVPDSIFCNTLMNAYAKLGEHESARSILNAMLDLGNDGFECHEGIPPTAVTVVTYNTLADACKTAGELGSALEVLELMTSHAEVKGDKSLLPDARTYTILISTVARKKKNDKEARDLRSGGENDPDMAFALLNRMISEGIVPNGMTYCALIDVCSRCRRIDLALNGLRIMLAQKSKASLSTRNDMPMYHQQALYNEVGAWTAAINAAGKTGRTDTAIRLFRTMQKVNVKPNAVTCGCLSDCLLKATPIRMTETLEVLQYMEKEGLAPSPVMYTSLMGIALTLAEKESGSLIRKDGLELQVIDKFDKPSSGSVSDTTSDAIVLYTELMRCLVHDGNDDMLLNVFLVFQEMKNAGMVPDIACYNSLLRACVLTGDIEKTKDVFRRMNADEIEPNQNTWRGTLKAARKARRSDIADTIWNTAVSYHSYQKKDVVEWIPTIADVELLMSVYLNELRSTSSHNERNLINKKVMNLYEGIMNGSEERGLHHLSVDELEENQEFMLAIIRAAVSYELHAPTNEEKIHAKELACDIAGLEMFQHRLPQHSDRASKKSLSLAQKWMYSY